MSSALPPVGGDVNRGPTFLAISLTTTSIALLTCILRIFVRVRIVRSIGWDDYMIMVAIVLGIIGSGLNVPEVSLGTGRHEFYLTEYQQVESTKFNELAQPWLIMSTCFSKISICLFLLRIIDHQNRNWEWFLYCQMLLLFAVNAVCSITILVQCQPIDKLWNRLAPGNCWPPQTQQAMGYFQGVFSSLSDFALAGFPVLILKGLKMNKRTKVALCMILGLGVFAGVCAIVRTYEISTLASRGDFTFTSIDLAIWALFEQNVAIVAANIPTFRPLFSKIFGIITARSRGIGDPSDYNYEHQFSSLTPAGGVNSKNGATRVWISGSRSKNLDEGDTGSETNILPVQAVEHGGIRRTTSVQVMNRPAVGDDDVGKRDQIIDQVWNV